MFRDDLFQLVGLVCVSASLSFVALLIAAFARRWADGTAGAAADVADSLE